MKAVRELTWMLGVSDNVTGVVNSVNKGIDNIKLSMKGVDQKLIDTGKNLRDFSKKTLALSAPIMAVGGKAINTVSKFDDSMSNTKAVTNATIDEIDRLREQTLKLGVDGYHTVQEVSEAMGILGTAGKSVNEIGELTPNILTLMSAGAIDVNVAAETLTGTMAQFGLESKDGARIVDVFAKGAASAKTDIKGLQEAFAMAGGELASMNMDIEKSVAMTGLLGDANIQAGRAGSVLSAMSRDIKASQDEFRRLGIGIYDTTGEMKDMGSILTELETKVGSMGDEQRNMALASIFSGQSMRGVNAFLAQGSDRYYELEQAMYGAKGEGNRMAEDMQDNIGGAFRSLKASGSALLVEVGDVFKDDVKAWASGIDNLIQKFGGLDDSQKQTIVRAALLVPAIGGVVGVVGVLAGALGNIIGLVKVLAASKLVTFLLANPAVLAAGAAAFGGYKLYQYGTKKRDEKLASMRAGNIDGSHKDGISKIPFDGYIGELHKNEEVLTADDPRNINNNKSFGNSISFNPNININVEGNADNETVSSLDKTIRDIIRDEREVFFKKLRIQGV